MNKISPDSTTKHLSTQLEFEKNIQIPDTYPVTVQGGAVDMCYRYGHIVIIGLLISYIFYYSYNNFCENQKSEPFIEKTIQTGIKDDKSFNVDDEVKRLSDLQEQYLNKLHNQSK
jgi:hypothetical protein